MYFAQYLLSLREFQEAERGEALLEEALSRLDETRRDKAAQLRPGRPREACVGGGLLLQQAVRDAFLTRGNEYVYTEGLRQYSVTQLLAWGKDVQPVPLTYKYGERGKPYFRDLPFYFNLSHSGDYVLCGLGSEELGADIQQYQPCDRGKLARRFFTKQEAETLEAVGEDEALFFRLWTRKEAYGKLTGKGIMGALARNLLPGGPGEDRVLRWQEYDVPAGYSIAFCMYGDDKLERRIGDTTG